MLYFETKSCGYWSMGLKLALNAAGIIGVPLCLAQTPTFSLCSVFQEELLLWWSVFLPLCLGGGGICFLAFCVFLQFRVHGKGIVC